MAFFKKSKEASYDFLYGYAWHVPGIKGMFLMLGLLLAGSLVGNLVILLFSMFMPKDIALTYASPVSYVIMFIPPMMVSHSISLRNMTWDKGYSLDNNNFQPLGGLKLGLLSMAGILCLAFCLDLVNKAMPPVPERLEKMMETLTESNIWINILSVSILAPIFEEWLCRGTILRGLLNYSRSGLRATKDGEDGHEGEKRRGMEPVWAIVISALFFAFIHLNPWQGIPAFMIGCLMGYVYYKTGSLKLTMLMHCTNNTLALILSNIDSLKDYETFVDMLGWKVYLVVFVIAAVILWLSIRTISKVVTPDPHGACEELSAGD